MGEKEKEVGRLLFIPQGCQNADVCSQPKSNLRKESFKTQTKTKRQGLFPSLLHFLYEDLEKTWPLMSSVVGSRHPTAPSSEVPVWVLVKSSHSQGGLKSLACGAHDSKRPWVEVDRVLGPLLTTRF